MAASLAVVSTQPAVQFRPRPVARSGGWNAGRGPRAATAARPALGFVEAASPDDLADLRASPERLAPLLARSGGSAHLPRPGEAPELRMVAEGASASAPAWIGLRRRNAHLVTGVSSVPLLPAWAGLPLLLGLVLLAWRREGR